MSRFTDNLTSRMVALGMDIASVTSEMNRRGFSVAYSTVAGWLNGSRGTRWNVEELRGLLACLQTDLDAMAGAAELVEEPVPAMIAHDAKALTPEQQQAVLAMVRSMLPKT